jgi:hypothetical protein
MRTTLNIDDDLLVAARDLADRQGTSLGAVISNLVRQALRPRRKLTRRNGIPLLPASDAPTPVTLTLVNQLRDGEVED